MTQIVLQGTCNVAYSKESYPYQVPFLSYLFAYDIVVLCLHSNVEFNNCGLKTSVLMTRKTVPGTAGIKRHQVFLFLHSDIFPFSLLHPTPPNPKVLVIYDVIIKSASM